MKNKMDRLTRIVSQLLRQKGIPFSVYGERLHVNLPSDFGQIEIGGLSEDDSIIGLVNHEWHTHGDLLVPDYGNDIPSAIVAFLEAIFSGNLKMVEYQLPGEEPKRIIEDDLDSFLKYQQPGEKNRLFSH
jgi:hypothetical protein